MSYVIMTSQTFHLRSVMHDNFHRLQPVDQLIYMTYSLEKCENMC